MDYGLQYEVGWARSRADFSCEGGRTDRKCRGRVSDGVGRFGSRGGRFYHLDVWQKMASWDGLRSSPWAIPIFWRFGLLNGSNRQAVSNEGGHQGQGGGQRGGAEGQKQVIIAIWNLRKGAAGDGSGRIR